MSLIRPLNVKLDYVQNDNKLYHSDPLYTECKICHYKADYSSYSRQTLIEEKNFDNPLDALNYLRSTNICAGDTFTMTYLKSGIDMYPVQVVAIASEDNNNIEIMGNYQFLVEVIMSNLNDKIRNFLIDNELRMEAYLSPRPMFLLKDIDKNIVFSSLRDYDMSKMCPEVLYLYVQFHSILGLDFTERQFVFNKKAEG